MRLRGDTEIVGTAGHLGYQVCTLHLHGGQFRGFRVVRLWADGSHRVYLVIAHSTGLPAKSLLKNPAVSAKMGQMPS